MRYANDIPKIPLPSYTQLNAVIHTIPSPPIIKSGLTWLRDKLYPLHEREELQIRREQNAIATTAGHDPLDYFSGTFDNPVSLESDEDTDDIEKISIPALKESGIESGVWIGGMQKSKKQVSDERATEYQEDRQRVRKVKKMLEMGQSQLLMPSQHAQHRSCSVKSDISASSYVLTGSSLLMPTKVEIEPHKRAQVERDLADALSTDFFNVWPTYQDERPGQAARGMKEESPEFRGVGKYRRGELMKEWKAKEERSIAGRRRVEGGHEDVVEAKRLRRSDGFRPSLTGVVFAQGEDGSKVVGDRERRESMNKRRDIRKGQQQRATRPAFGERDNRLEHGSKTESRRRAESRTVTEQGRDRGSIARNRRDTTNEKSNERDSQMQKDTQSKPESKTKNDEQENESSSDSDELVHRRTLYRRRPSFRNDSESSEDRNPFAMRPSRPSKN